VSEQPPEPPAQWGPPPIPEAPVAGASTYQVPPYQQPAYQPAYQPPPKRGSNVWVLALLFLLVAGAIAGGLYFASDSSDDGELGSGTTTTESVVAAPEVQAISSASAQECVAERASLITAYSAAALSSLPGGTPAKYSDFLKTPIKYFEVPNGPTTGRIPRVPRTLPAVPLSSCPPIFQAEVPVGSN